MNYDLSQAKQFLALLFRDEEYVTICSQAPGLKGIAPASLRTVQRHAALDEVSCILDQGHQAFFGTLPRLTLLSDGKKGTEAEIAPGRVAYVDIDFKDNPKREDEILAILRKYSPPPSVLIHSGNGFHAYWLLDKPYAPAAIKQVNLGLKHALAQASLIVDACQSADHVFRLPGSLNLKDVQQPKLCEIIDSDWHPEYRYPLLDLPQAVPSPPKTSSSFSLQTISSDPEHVALRNLELLSLIKHLPAKAQRMLLCGERMGQDGKTVQKQDRSQLAFDTIQQLVSQGWTDKQIHELFLGIMPIKAVHAFQKKYRNRGADALAGIISKVRATEQSYGNILPRLLDQEHLLGERKLITVEPKGHPCFTESVTHDLRRLATLAQELYDGTRTGCVMAPLPMGAGKTVRFLLPFVAHCATQTPDKGIIVAMERRQDIVENAKAVNALACTPVAFALLGHDPDTCLSGCEAKHKRDREQSFTYPILFLTHAMLVRRGAEPFQAWAQGERVLVIIDEKPAVWWQKGFLSQNGLQSLATQGMQHDALTEAQELLSTGTVGQSITLKTQFTERQFRAFTKKHEDDENTTENGRGVAAHALFLLSQHGGRIVPLGKEKGIIVAHRVSLPSLPTLILDATGILEPEYPCDIPVLQVFPQQGLVDSLRGNQDIETLINAVPCVKLRTWDETLTKTKLTPNTQDASKDWAYLLTDIKCSVLPRVPGEQVYIVCTKNNHASLEQVLSKCMAPEDQHRIKMIDHYGNTKGKNDYNEAGAIVFTSVQFKQEWWYRALALETGRGNSAVQKGKVGNALRFRDADVEEQRVRDQLVTVLQEIGRTRLRKGQPIFILLPWANQQAIEAVKQQLSQQFFAHVSEHTKMCIGQEQTQKDQLLALLELSHMVRKRDVAQTLGVKPQRLTTILASEDIQKELWGRHIENEGQVLIVPQESPTEQALKELEH